MESVQIQDITKFIDYSCTKEGNRNFKVGIELKADIKVCVRLEGMMEIDQGKAKRNSIFENTQKKELVKNEPMQFHVSVTSTKAFLVFSGYSGHGMWSWSHPVKEESFEAQLPA